MANLTTIPVTTPEGDYSIFVGAGALAALPLPPHQAANCAIITQPRIGALYAESVSAALRARGIEPHLVEIPDGEKFKTLATVSSVYDRLVEAQLDRHSLVLALGGGVVGDLAGLVAATFLRGMPFVQIPTTLLAMVDASIGGKVAVDHPRGKNLIGAFKQPLAVITDTNTLATLPEAEWRSGMAEVIKHAIIGDTELFELLEHQPTEPVENWLARAIQVKAYIVMEDLFEQNKRLVLNLGHTFGHAFELLSHYELRHGDAVAIGLVCATRLASQRNLCEPSLVERIENLLCELDLPTHVPAGMTSDAIVTAMSSDKKRLGSRLRFVLPRALGDVVIVDDVTREEVVRVLEEK